MARVTCRTCVESLLQRLRKPVAPGIEVSLYLAGDALAVSHPCVGSEDPRPRISVRLWEDAREAQSE